MKTFCATGHLCGEFTGHRWIPRAKASDAELWCFKICAWINDCVNNGEAGDLRRYRAHYAVTVMRLRENGVTLKVVYKTPVSNHNNRDWPCMKWIDRSTVDSPLKGQWRGALMFSLMYAWLNGWATFYVLVIWDAIMLIMTSIMKMGLPMVRGRISRNVSLNVFDIFIFISMIWQHFPHYWPFCREPSFAAGFSSQWLSLKKTVERKNGPVANDLRHINTLRTRQKDAI